MRLHRLFDKLDEYLRCRGERLLAPADVTAELALPPLHVDTIRLGDRWYPDQAGTTALQRCEVDLWLCFAAVPPSRLPRSVSRLGAWGIEVGETVSATNAWAGAVELSAGSPVTMVSVVDYAEAADALLYRSFGATRTNSPRRNRLRALRKGVSSVKRLVQRLTLDKHAWPPMLPVTLPAPADYPTLPAPTIHALARLSWRLAANWVTHRLPSRRRLEQWQIAYYFADEEEPGCRLDQLRYLIPPEDRFWADPFAVEYQGRYFIFFEELLYRTGKGRLAAIEVVEDAEPGEAQVVLERPYHLSYPFIFEWEGALYMIPETAQNRTVEVYHCEAFPHRWRLHKVLLDNVNAVDATLWRGDDRWWMFVNVAEPGVDNTDELHLYWSRAPFGPWVAHPGNPIISDVRGARPAGPLFSRDGRLYRPSQDCSVAYGHSVLINCVETLDEHEYRETAIHRIAPGWREDALRVHTVSGSKRLRIIDCMMRR
ncbi:MAG: glucosamine inositolphosphorylceramide transferase family protein [Opitutaceae bacterium]